MPYAAEMAERAGWAPAENAGLVEAYMAAWDAAVNDSSSSGANPFLEQARARVGPTRNDNALRRKAHNVSAVLHEAELPYFPAFAPQSNRQKSLDDVVFEALRMSRQAEAMEAIASRPAPQGDDAPESMTQSPPPLAPQLEDQTRRRRRVAVQRDYAAAEAKNRSLGRAGEELTVAHYQHVLRAADRDDLARRVEHVAAVKGDGLGFDVLAYEPDGTELHVEVKTTRGPHTHPFFISAAEIAAADDYGASYRLVRIYDYGSTTGTKFYVLSGPVRDALSLTPTTFSAIPSGGSVSAEG